MNDENNKSLNETKRILGIIQKKVKMNKISVNDFVYYYMILRSYIFLGAKDYLPYVEALTNAYVIIYTSYEQESYEYFMKELKKIIMSKPLASKSMR